MAVTDQAAGSPTGTFDPVERELFDRMIIKILRKVIAIFEENRYHSLVGTRGHRPFVWEQDRIGSPKFRSCLFQRYRTKDSIKSSGIKDRDGNHVRIFDAELFTF